MDNIVRFLNFNDPDLVSDPPRIEDGRRVVTLRRRPAPRYCTACGSRMHSRGVYRRRINHPIMQDGLQLVLELEQRRWKCTNAECGLVVNDEFGFVRRYQHNSDEADRLIAEAFRDPSMTAVRIAERFSVSDTYALKVFSEHVRMERGAFTEAICIDEVRIDVRGCKYALVILDFATGEPIDMISNRRSEFTEAYFSSVPAAERAKVKYIISDLYKPYTAFASRYFPNAISVIDSFHVVKFINDKINVYISTLAKNIRRQDEAAHRERDALLGRRTRFVPSREYYLLRNFKWVILSNRANLNYSAPARFDRRLGRYVTLRDIEDLLFAIDPALSGMRDLKEKYIQFNDSHINDTASAGEALASLIAEYRASEYPAFREIADMLEEYSIAIVNSFVTLGRICPDGVRESRLSNGPAESLNRIVKDLKRNARGYRNFEHLRNRFLYARRPPK